MMPATFSTREWECLCDEMELLRFALLREVNRFTEACVKSDAHFQGLALSAQEILSILSDEHSETGHTSVPAADQEFDRLEQTRLVRLRSGCPSRLQRLSQRFNLGRLEQQCIMLCLAPEIDSRYTKVFAYLQDDVTRRLPEIELALRLFCHDLPARTAARGIFSSQAPLRDHQLIQIASPTEALGPQSHRWMCLDDRIVSFLLGSVDLDATIGSWVTFSPVAEEPHPLSSMDSMHVRATAFANARSAEFPDQRPILYIHGGHGSAHRELAEGVCSELRIPLLTAHPERIPASLDRMEAWRRLGREATLQGAAILVNAFDSLREQNKFAETEFVLDSRAFESTLTFLSARTPWRNGASTCRRGIGSLELPTPPVSVRAQLWNQYLAELPHNLTGAEIAELAAKFRLTPSQIKGALRAASGSARLSATHGVSYTLELLNRACRDQTAPNLGTLAPRIEAAFTWPDLVLPRNLLSQLQEIVTHVRQSHVVLEQWGFESKLPYGRAVTGLLHGGSGTGKTMAASIIAGELGLDLYKIDLSMVVSKYIGETEKNLGRIFAEAQDSNAILFFDEADALFGKRSAVKDAHDRYANIETAYLLQRVEAYSGIILLASNMKHNLDDAFLRRMRFVLHFPFPGVEDRERIWRGSFPRQAPMAKDVDFGWLARKLELSGGHIKNISLRAAFLAAEQDRPICMNCLKEAARLELEKHGKITDFGSGAPLSAARCATEAAA